jgi:HEAT repeat protein
MNQRTAALATLFFLCGAAAGYWLSVVTRPAPARGGDGGAPADVARESSPTARRGSAAAEPSGGAASRDAWPLDAKFPERDPFAELGPEELEAELRDAAASGDLKRLQRAAEALGRLEPAQVERLAGLMLAAGNSKTADVLARALVRFGGPEGLEAVARMARDADASIETRARAIEALAGAPPETRDAALAAFAELLQSGLPQKLEFHAAHACGRLFGEGQGVAGLLGLLESGTIRAEPLLHAVRDLARAEDIPRLTEMLGRTRGREGDELLLRAIGSAAGPQGSAVLLDMLRNPPEGVARKAVGGALAELARREDLPALWESLQAETDRGAQAELARAIARAGGGPEIEKLAALAADPASGLSREAFARAVHDAATVENVPLLLDALRDCRGWESAEPLARSITRLVGREGVEKLLEIAESGGSEERRRAVIQAIEDFGDAADVDRLASLLARETDHAAAFHLAKAILRLDPAQGPAALAERYAEISSGNGRAALADILAREGSSALIPTLGRLFESESHGRAQWHLARALASFGPEGVAAVGELLSRDSDPRRRGEALAGVESVSPEDAVALARGFLGDPSPELRGRAMKVVAGSRDPADAELLLRTLESEADPKLRESIESLLRERGR